MALTIKRKTDKSQWQRMVSRRFPLCARLARLAPQATSLNSNAFCLGEEDRE